MKRSVLEKKTQADIEAAIGAEPDLLVLRNSVGRATYHDDDGKPHHVPYGLGVGSPDLVCLLRVEIRFGDGQWIDDKHVARTVTAAVWFCLEVKADEGALEPEQMKCHEVWRRFGALIYVVRSVGDARKALAEARKVFE